MAIAVRAVSNGGWVSGAGPIATSWPAGITHDDYCLLVFVRSELRTEGAMSGWTGVTGLVEQLASGSGFESSVYKRVYQSGDTAPSINWTGGNCYGRWAIIALSGVAAPSGDIDVIVPRERGATTGIQSLATTTTQATFMLMFAMRELATATGTWISSVATAGSTTQLNDATVNGQLAILSWTEATAVTAKVYNATGTGTAITNIDMIALVEDTGGGTTPVSGSDSATGTETEAVSATAPGSESSTGTDAGTASVTASGSDAATGTDTGAVSVTAPGSDSATGTDAGTASVTGTGVETSTGTDTGAVSATVTGSDSGTGTDSGVVDDLSATQKTGSDSATGTDTGTVSVTVTSSDSGSATDAGSVIDLSPVAKTGSDSAVGADTGTLLDLTPPPEPEPEPEDEGGAVDESSFRDEFRALVGGDAGVGREGASLKDLTPPAPREPFRLPRLPRKLATRDTATGTETGRVLVLAGGADMARGAEADDMDELISKRRAEGMVRDAEAMILALMSED